MDPNVGPRVRQRLDQKPNPEEFALGSPQYVLGAWEVLVDLLLGQIDPNQMDAALVEIDNRAAFGDHSAVPQKRLLQEWTTTKMLGRTTSLATRVDDRDIFELIAAARELSEHVASRAQEDRLDALNAEISKASTEGGSLSSALKVMLDELVPSARIRRATNASRESSPVKLAEDPTSSIPPFNRTGNAPQHPVGSMSTSATSNGKTSLMHWAAVGDEAKIRALLHQGADISATDDEGDDVLRYALTSRNNDIFSMLLRSGANPNAASTYAHGRTGFKILHAVVEAGWDDALIALVQHGADVNASGSGGITPMMLAAGAGKDRSIRTLLNHGADISAVDDDGDSVLYYASSKGHGSTVDLLLELGANPDPRPGASGMTPLSVAAQLASPFARRLPGIPASDYTRIALALLRAGADASPMYDAGLILQRQTPRGLEIVPLELVPRLVATNANWGIAHMTPEGRRQLAPTLSVVRPASTPRSVRRPASPPRSAPTALGKGRIEVIGSTQMGFAMRPTIKVYWNGQRVGSVAHGGSFGFDIETDGVVQFRHLFRSAKIRVKASRVATIHLSWDRDSGRLLAGPRDRAD